jgi:hypothetical protein
MSPGQDVRRASRGRRTAAAVVDLVPFLPFVALGLRRTRAGGRVTIRQRLLVRSMQAGYFTVTTSVLGGSPGQLMMGLRVVDADTMQRPTWRQAFLRWAVDAVPTFLLQVLTSLRPSRRQTTRDELNARFDEVAQLRREDLDDDTLNARAAELSEEAVKGGLSAVQAAGVVVMIAYYVTIGRRGRDGVTNTIVVQR